MSISSVVVKVLPWKLINLGRNLVVSFVILTSLRADS